MPAQQRFTRNRRPLIAQQQWQPQLVRWYVDEVDDASIFISFEVDMQSTSAPAFYSTGGLTVYGVNIVGPNRVEIDVAEGWPDNSAVQLDAWDTGMRTEAGGYLAPGIAFITHDGGMKALLRSMDKAAKPFVDEARAAEEQTRATGEGKAAAPAPAAPRGSGRVTKAEMRQRGKSLGKPKT